MRYDDDDRLRRMRVCPQARKRNPDLPTHWDVREVSYVHRGKRKSVLTSLPANTYNVHRSPSKACAAKGGEDFQDPISRVSKGCSA